MPETTTELQPWQQRVIDEAAALSDKLTKLRDMIAGDHFPSLPVVDQVDLRLQAEQMHGYLETLQGRIGRF